MKLRFITATVLCVATATLVGVFALNGSRSSANNPTASNGAGGAPPTTVAQTVRFTVYDVGILPRQAKARAGKVALAIEDLSGASAELVVAKTNNGAAAAAGRVRRSPGAWRGRTVIHLEPGTYEVFDSNRPNNRAELVVTP
ncbi:MAG TPA: hypothetical protein VFR80_11800 [Pyrinomonadaceae bacterium]|nr:hypothetical protein [Pyrinomonadaceae bacterium]